MESEEEDETLGLVSEGSLIIRQNQIQVKSKIHKKLGMLCSKAKAKSKRACKEII